MKVRFLLLLLPLLAACPGPYAPVPDGGTQLIGGDAGVGEDAGETGAEDAGADAGTIDAGFDAGWIVQVESEPNNGDTVDGVNEVQLPADVSGAIDPAGDLDILHFNHAAGEVWTYTLAPGDEASTFAPHLAVAEHANQVPTLVAAAAAGEVARQEHFTLSSGRYNVFVRDARNVPSSTGVGGPAFTWRFVATPTPREPTEVAVPSTTQGALAFPRAIGLYRFTLSSETNVRIELRAKGKASPSDLDTQLSLFDANAQQWIATNDDVSLGETDSELGGTFQAGTYTLVVENLEPAAGDLTYELAVVTP